MKIDHGVGAGAALWLAIGGFAIWKIVSKQRRLEGCSRATPNGAGGLLEWQARRERRAVAEAAPEQRLYVSLYRSLDKLARKADELGEGVFQALRRHRGGTLNAELERWAAQLEDVLTQLDALPLGQGHGVWRLRSRRRQLVLTVQAELESLDVFLHDFSVGRSAMRKLNALLDGLCEKQPDFVCPITRDVMLRPVVASSGQTFEAVALREHCAGQRRRRGDVHAKCPVTKQALRPAEERPNKELGAAINSAVEAAIAGSGASEEEQAAMWARWSRGVN